MTPHAKAMVAKSMYMKGKGFLGAALLLRMQGERSGMPQPEAYHYVTLHNLCQGIELILKAVLLLRDYDRYKAQLRKPLSHDLIKATNQVIANLDLNPLRPRLARELDELNALYKDHILRYGSSYDIFVDPRSIEHDAVWRRMRAALRLAERELRESDAMEARVT